MFPHEPAPDGIPNLLFDSTLSEDQNPHLTPGSENSQHASCWGNCSAWELEKPTVKGSEGVGKVRVQTAYLSVDTRSFLPWIQSACPPTFLCPSLQRREHHCLEAGKEEATLQSPGEGISSSVREHALSPLPFSISGQ